MSILPSDDIIREYLSTLGKKGGRSKSPAKQAASRANGKKHLSEIRKMAQVTGKTEPQVVADLIHVALEPKEVLSVEEFNQLVQKIKE
jgi:hypothetical protein